LCGDDGHHDFDKIALSLIFIGNLPQGSVSRQVAAVLVPKGAKLKQHKVQPSKSEDELQSKESLYAKLLRAARFVAEDGVSVADVLRVCLNRVCECTQWPFAHARILSQGNDLVARGPNEVWRVPFLDPQRFRDKALRMNRLRSGADWRMEMVTTASPAVLWDLEHELDHKGQLAARELGLKSALGMPVLAADDIKAVCEFFSSDAIQPDALWEEIFIAIGDALAHAIEMSRSRERLRQMSGRFLTLQDEERRRLAGELHDTTGQNLSMLVLNIELLNRDQFLTPETHAKLGECADLARTSLQEVRTFSYVLHPPMLDDLGVFPALRSFIEGFSERSGIAVDLDLPNRSPRMPRELETTIFRVVQESLSNVRKHSHSSTASVRVTLNPDGVFIKVEDNGSGLPDSKDAEARPAKIGVGISSMQERVKHCGGRLQMHSESTGTQLEVSLPLPQTVRAATA
jgi:signal transduction histidine kinase